MGSARLLSQVRVKCGAVLRGKGVRTVRFGILAVAILSLEATFSGWWSTAASVTAAGGAALAVSSGSGATGASVRGGGGAAAAVSGAVRPTARVLQDRSPEQHKLTQQQWRQQWQALRQRLHRRGQQRNARELVDRSSWALTEEEARYRVPPRYSTHTCIGPKPDDRWQAATCKFDNVCLNASTQQFEYYQDVDLYPSMPVAYDQLMAQPHSQFAEHLVSPVQWMVDKTKKLSFRPHVVRRPFPQMGGRIKWAPTPQALLQSFPQRHLVNFGHVMYELAVPLYNMQHLFGIYRRDAQVLVLNETLEDTWEGIDFYMKRMINTPDPARSLFRLSWDSDALWISNYTRQVLGDDGDGLICFKTLLVGTGNLTRRGRATDALPYRDAVAHRLGLHEPPFGREEQPVITLLDKEGRRIVENWGDVYEMLRERYPGARVQYVDFGKHPDLTMAEQVQLMSDTSILLSPCGGLATVLTFLRPSATAIVMNFWHTHLNRSVHMEEQFYTNLEYLDVQYFPVTPADYEGTSDRPECELVPNGTRRHDSRYPQSGMLVNCNVYLGPQAMQRMQHYVDQAMLRWASRYGRYDVLEPLRRQRAAELEAAGVPLPASHKAAAEQAAAAAQKAAAAAAADDEEEEDSSSLSSEEEGGDRWEEGADGESEESGGHARHQQQRQHSKRQGSSGKAKRRGKALVEGAGGDSSFSRSTADER